jgi:hypothetical protein
MSALLSAVDFLNERLVLAEAIGDALAAAAPPDNPPSWVFVYRQQIEAIQLAASEVESMVRLGGDL